ncbi:hypothetical protein CF127_17100 [Aeromonas veronii]|nr:hypothetical protein CF127_17100 [Aeromonas veronii]TNI53457.1 hypothetical protein CF125_13040 [Aeromonas veronii]
MKMVFQRVEADCIIQIIRCKVGISHRLMKYQGAALKRWNAPVYGFRVCEAHHDGTPHWHLLLFMRPEDRNRVIGILQRYALTDDHEELVRDIKDAPPFTDFTPRFDWKEIDRPRGMLRAISPNILPRTSTAPTWTMTKRPAPPPMRAPCMPSPGPVGGAFAPSSRSEAPRSGDGASCAASATPRSMPSWLAHPSQCCKTHTLRPPALPQITASFAATCTP